MCSRTSKLCHEQLVHQPGVGSNRALDQTGSVQGWRDHPTKEGNLNLVLLSNFFKLY